MTAIPYRSARMRSPLKFLGLALLVIAGCTPAADPSAKGKAPDGPPATPTVKTAKPMRKTMTHRIEQPGEIKAFEQAPIHARISGYVSKVYKDIGDPVKEGELLAELAVPEMAEELMVKQAETGVAQATVEQAKKLQSAAEADLKSAAAKLKETEASQLRVAAELKRAESQYARFKKSESVLTSENLDEARLNVEANKAAVAEVEARVGSAEAARISAEARRDKSDTDIKLAAAHLKSAQADERRTAELLKYAKLSAPFAGVVTWRNVDPGHLLEPKSGMKAEPVFVVASVDPVRVFVDVPETDAVLVHDGTPALVRVQALKGETFKGAVTRTAWSLDPKQRTMRAEIDLKNPAGRLRPGMYAFAAITLEHANTWTVPASAVLTQGEQTFCFVASGGKALRLRVQTGFRDSTSVEVLKKQSPDAEGRWHDFVGTEEVITNNLASLSDGQAIIVP